MSENAPFIPDDFKYSTSVSSCENSVRLKFLRNVYSILLLQLAATFAFGLFVYTSPNLQLFILSRPWLSILSCLVAFATCIWLSVAPSIDDEEHQSRFALSFTQQALLLTIFTIAESYFLSLVIVCYSGEVLLNAVMVTLFIVIGITSTLVSTSYFKVYDFNKWYYWLNLSIWFLMGLLFSSMFFKFNSNTELLISWAGCIIFTLYIFIDTQLILRKVFVGEEIKCAMMLYLDIINLFLYVLRILSRNDDN